MPKRIQRKRTKGWRMPEGAIYVGRPTKWGNPFEVVDVLEAFGGDEREARADCVRSYRESLFRDDEYVRLASAVDAMRELRGKDLACWCPLDQPCHADVLLEVANGDPAGETKRLREAEIQIRELRARLEVQRETPRIDPTEAHVQRARAEKAEGEASHLRRLLAEAWWRGRASVKRHPATLANGPRLQRACRVDLAALSSTGEAAPSAPSPAGAPEPGGPR